MAEAGAAPALADPAAAASIGTRPPAPGGVGAAAVPAAAGTPMSGGAPSGAPSDASRGANMGEPYALPAEVRHARRSHSHTTLHNPAAGIYRNCARVTSPARAGGRIRRWRRWWRRSA
jgi:hypothetical protein